ncbi:hypothetical protein DIPPA_23470 [Diplonema papillatum]|nr:hypothetical protein DIPPA_23470 [Diplonema papillatum]
MQFLPTAKGLKQVENGRERLLSKKDVLSIRGEIDTALAEFRPVLKETQAERDSLAAKLSKASFQMKAVATICACASASWAYFVSRPAAVLPEQTVLNTRLLRWRGEDIHRKDQVPVAFRSNAALRFLNTKAFLSFLIVWSAGTNLRYAYVSHSITATRYAAVSEELSEVTMDRDRLLDLQSNINGVLQSPPYA